MSCFGSTHAPVATAACAAATGLVSMSTRPDIPGMLHLEREVRDWSTYNEYCCCCTYIVVALIPISLLNIEGVACRIFLPLAQTHQNPGGKAFYFFMRKANEFLETYFRKHYY